MLTVLLSACPSLPFRARPICRPLCMENTKNLMEKGSENCPIDLTVDEEHGSSVEHFSVRRDLFNQHESENSLMERVKNLEKKMKKNALKNSEQEKIDHNVLSLDRRVQRIENFIRGLCGIFSAPQALEAIQSRDDALSKHSKKRKSTEKCGNNSSPAKKKIIHKSQKSSKEQNIGTSAEQASKESALINSSLEISGMASNSDRRNHTVSIPQSTRTEVLDQERKQDCESFVSNEIEAHPQKSDVKLELLPKLTSVKEEVQLIRDDAGRILIFLCSAAKKLTGSESVVGVAGTYLQQDWHNEYIFTKNDSTKNVRLEADMRGALFGLEVIRALYPENKDGLCLMFISQCTVLVKIMKYKHCSRETVATQSPIWPQLLASMEGIQVHWCVSANISVEEKKIMNDYQKIVNTTMAESYKTISRG